MASESTFFDKLGFEHFWANLSTMLSGKADTTAIPTKLSQLTNDTQYITLDQVPEGSVASNTVPKMNGVAAVGTENGYARGDHVHPTDTTRLATDGDAKTTIVTFTQAAERVNVTSGDTMAVLFGKIAKFFADQGTLAYKSEVAKSDLASDVQTSLTKADTALQSYTETDPTVPDWAKQATKPTYTAAEVGALSIDTANSDFAKKSDLVNVYKYKGSVADYASLPTTNLTAGDVYNTEDTNMNYGWTGTTWDPLGEIFQIATITNAEIDQIMGVSA